MLFNSYSFLVFFAIIVSLYYALNHKYRWILLLMGSYYFYMSWKVEYIGLIIASTAVDYFCALQIHRTNSSTKKKWLLGISILVNLGLLFSFKYYDFFTSSAESVLGFWSLAYHFPHLEVLLPVGISFYTFQTLSYTIDVYRGTTPPEKHLGRFALYVSFFPQLVAGPIERSFQLLPQLFQKVEFDYLRIRNGLILMTWGFFKKLLIADRVAEYVNLVYQHPQDYGGLQAMIATYFFSFQIYCDFSGYSDIAIGAAMVLGITLMDNFRQPYLSANIREFWSRWHISLTTWFRDYLYIPLGGNQVTKWRWYYNLIVVFVISGLWHGANWTFVIWGLLHGVMMVALVIRGRLGIALPPHRFPQISRIFQVFFTFHFVALGWIFFRANTLEDAGMILSRIIHLSTWTTSVNLFRFPIDFGLSVAFILFLISVELLQSYGNLNRRLAQLPSGVKWVLFLAALMTLVVLGKFNGADFLYFQF